MDAFCLRLHAAGIETRIEAAVFSGSFRDNQNMSKLVDMPIFGAADTICCAETAALVTPRRLFVENGRQDELIPVAAGHAEVERVAQARCQASPGGNGWRSD